MFTDTANWQTNYDPADIEYRWAYEGSVDGSIMEDFAGEAAKVENILMIISRHINQGTFRNINYFVQTNQNREQLYYYSCTIHSTFGCIADMFSLTRETYETYVAEIVKYMLEKWWYDPNTWAFTANSAKAAEYIWNKHNPDRQVKLIITEIGTALFWTLSSFGYSFAMTYLSSKDYSIDASDGILDQVIFEQAKGWHSIRWKNTEILGKWKKPKGVTALDNYFTPDKKDYKRYSIPRTHIPHLKNSEMNKTGRYFPRCYSYLEVKYLN